MALNDRDYMNRRATSDSSQARWRLPELVKDSRLRAFRAKLDRATGQNRESEEPARLLARELRFWTLFLVCAIGFLYGVYRLSS